MTAAARPGGATRVTQILRPARGAYSIERVYADVRAQLPADIAVRVWTCPHASRGLGARLRGALAARRVAGGLCHVTGDAHYLGLFLPRARTIHTVHDCDFVTRARGLKRFLLWLFWLRLPLVGAGAVVVPSEASRQELLALVPLDPARVVVIENPVSAGFRPAPPPAPSNGPLRVLQIGTKPNKNLERLAAALAGLEVTLFIVGRPGAAQHAALAAAGLSYAWREGLSEAELADAYRACEVLAFCSLSEGFGLPIVEAQAVGRAVVTSDRAPMREVAGAGAELVDPEDADDMRRAFARLAADPARRRALVASGRENAARFAAEGVAAAYARLYRRLARAADQPGARP